MVKSPSIEEACGYKQVFNEDELKGKYPELYEQAIGSKENYIMSNLGYFKVYGCGNILWEKTYERN